MSAQINQSYQPQHLIWPEIGVSDKKVKQNVYCLGYTRRPGLEATALKIHITNLWNFRMTKTYLTLSQ